MALILPALEILQARPTARAVPTSVTFPAQEQRQRDRRLVYVPAILACDQLVLECRTQNLSLEGAAVFSPAPVRIGSRCQLTLKAWTVAKGHELTIDGRVTNVILAGIDGFRIGISFHDVSPDAHLELDKLLNR